MRVQIPLPAPKAQELGLSSNPALLASFIELVLGASALVAVVLYAPATTWSKNKQKHKVYDVCAVTLQESQWRLGMGIAGNDLLRDVEILKLSYAPWNGYEFGTSPLLWLGKIVNAEARISLIKTDRISVLVELAIYSFKFDLSNKTDSADAPTTANSETEESSSDAGSGVVTLLPLSLGGSYAFHQDCHIHVWLNYNVVKGGMQTEELGNSSTSKLAEVAAKMKGAFARIAGDYWITSSLAMVPEVRIPIVAMYQAKATITQSGPQVDATATADKPYQQWSIGLTALYKIGSLHLRGGAIWGPGIGADFLLYEGSANTKTVTPVILGYFQW